MWSIESWLQRQIDVGGYNFWSAVCGLSSVQQHSLNVFFGLVGKSAQKGNLVAKPESSSDLPKMPGKRGGQQKPTKPFVTCAEKDMQHHIS